MPHTKAWRTFEENLDFMHMLTLGHREAGALKTQIVRLRTVVNSFLSKGLWTKSAQAKLLRSFKEFNRTVKTRVDRIQTLTRWQVVMIVTCVEAYLQDVLSTAASVDPELMSKSEQCARYADVIAATSVDALANKLRVRWARGWLSDGGRRAGYRGSGKWE